MTESKSDESPRPHMTQSRYFSHERINSLYARPQKRWVTSIGSLSGAKATGIDPSWPFSKLYPGAHRMHDVTTGR
jgi:hypothetical protein